MAEFDFWVPGRPVPKERPRWNRGRMVTPGRTLDYEARVAQATKGLDQLDGPVEVYMELSPEGVHVWAWEIDVVPSKLRGDVDNYVKSVLDGMQKSHLLKAGEGVIPEDKLVHRITATKCP